MTPCTDPYCASMDEHKSGAYNLASYPNEEVRTNNLASDIGLLLLPLYHNKRPDPAEYTRRGRDDPQAPHKGSDAGGDCKSWNLEIAEILREHAVWHIVGGD